jgi:uncharacterized protein (DUF1800 family)
MPRIDSPAFHRRAALQRLAWPAAWPAHHLLRAGGLLAGAAPGRAAAKAPAANEVQCLTLLERATWGATASDWSRCRQQGPQTWLKEQLAATHTALPAPVQSRIDALSISSQPLVERLAKAAALRMHAQQAATESERVRARRQYQQELAHQERESATRHLLRALHSPAQLREMMQWFWLNHFNVFARKGEIRALLADYEERAIRPHALGDFRALLGAVTRHPAMLIYLDNRQNAVGRGNENHARELLELHTLGVNAGYSQQDVQELARVLTGHGVRLDGRPDDAAARRPGAVTGSDGLYLFNPARHDTRDKTLLGQAIRSRAAQQLDEALDILVRHPSTARHITGRMARFFIGREAPAALVAQMAKAFGHGNIRAALEVLLNDDALRDPAMGGFKDPMRYVISAVRLVADGRPVLNTEPLKQALGRLGQALYARQTPDGYPLTSEAWNDPGQMTARFDLARQLAGGLPRLYRTPAEESPAPDAPTMKRAPPSDAMLPTARRPAPSDPALAEGDLMATWMARASASTRSLIDQATTPRERTALLLSSPEFMQR